MPHSTHEPRPSGVTRRRWFVATAGAVAGALALVGIGAALPGIPGGAGTSQLTDVVGDTEAESVAIGGAVGQEVAANFAPDQSGPEGPDASASSMWWRWTAPTSGPITFSTHGSELDTVLTVYPSTATSAPVATNDDEGDVRTSSVTFDATEGEEYLVEVSAKSPDPGLLTLSWQPPAPAAAALPEEPAAAAVTSTGIPLTGNTGEKPQSKLWSAGGTWWAVLASASTSPAGTWVWRYDAVPKTWTNVTRISERTDVRADVKAVGDVAHVLLHGPTTTLVSIQRDPQSNTYVPWTARAGATAVSLPGSETATIDIDSTGRMWVAWDTASQVQVRWSDAPYSSFSAPVTVASGITDDDIAVVTAMPGKKVGVLWSNQNTQRFGFRTHVDGASPSTWTADEVPAAGSALPVGGGMADDHLNVAVADDGTFYAAVKTSYNTADRTVIGLLVRHPDGTWDPLHEVDRVGTRGIVVVDDVTDRLRVVYTRSTNLDDILVKETSRLSPDFSGAAETVLDGSWNNATATKSNVPGEVLVMAASATTARAARLAWTPAGAPTAQDSTVATTVGGTVTGKLGAQATTDDPLTFQVVTPPTAGTLTAMDPATGAFTYRAGAASGLDSFTFRVGSGGLWSAPATVGVRVSSADGLVGAWNLDEGQGLVTADSSGWGNGGTLVGGSSWVPGVSGSAVRSDGATGLVRVPDSAALDVSTGLTVAAWVRPEQAATQYVVKKATNDAADGFELALASNGKPFLRLNEDSSGDTYRVNATSSYPTNGTWVHLVGSYDGTRMRIYVNGVEQASKAGPASIGTNASPLGIGAEGNGYRPVKGAVDGVRLYDRALSAAEVTTLFQGGTTQPTPAPVAQDVAVKTTLGQPVSGTLTATVPQGATPQFQVVTPPTRGTVALTSTSAGTFTYTPGASAGADSFTFRVGAGGQWSAPATVRVAVASPDGLVGAWEARRGSGARDRGRVGLGERRLPRRCGHVGPRAERVRGAVRRRDRLRPRTRRLDARPHDADDGGRVGTARTARDAVRGEEGRAGDDRRLRARSRERGQALPAAQPRIVGGHVPGRRHLHVPDGRHLGAPRRDVRRDAHADLRERRRAGLEGRSGEHRDEHAPAGHRGRVQRHPGHQGRRGLRAPVRPRPHRGRGRGALLRCEQLRARPGTDAGPHADSGPHADARPDSGPDADARPHADSGPDADARPDAGSHTGSGPDADARPDADP